MEFYCKDSAVDDTSINNMQQTNKDQEKRVVVAVERKTAQKVTWYELKLYHKNYELLVTGAVYGQIDEQTYESFLGSSKAPSHLVQQTHWIVIAPSAVVPFNRDMRFLQSFRNKASTFEWAFKSTNFFNKGFHTEHPLKFHTLKDKKVDYFSIASYILHCGSQGAIKDSQMVHCREIAQKIEFWKDLGLSKKPSSEKDIVEAIRKDRKLGKYKKWMLDFIFNEPRDASKNVELAWLYKQFLYHKLRAVNDKRMNGIAICIIKGYYVDHHLVFCSCLQVLHGITCCNKFGITV